MIHAQHTEHITTPGTHELVIAGACEGRMGIQVSISAGGDANYTVEHTINQTDDIWLPNTELTAKSVSADGNYIVPIAAVRLVVHSITVGTLCLHVLYV